MLAGHPSFQQVGTPAVIAISGGSIPAMQPLASLRSALAVPTVQIRFVAGFRHVLKRGYSCIWHAHSTYELVFHPTGSGSTRLASSGTVPFGPGALVIYPPSERHDQTMEDAGVDVCLHVEIATPTPITGGALAPSISDPRLRRECEDLAASHVLDDPLRQRELDHRVAALLCGIAAQPYDDGDHAARARDLIARDYAIINRLSDVSEKIGIGEDHLRHLFTDRYGMGPGQWLLAVRIDRARDLLARSTLPLLDVAEACGFRSIYHLGAAFRRGTGTSPMRWRRRHAPDQQR
jgi:AraC-like DNA-binding protein